MSYARVGVSMHLKWSVGSHFKLVLHMAPLAQCQVQTQRWWSRWESTFSSHVRILLFTCQMLLTECLSLSWFVWVILLVHLSPCIPHAGLMTCEVLALQRSGPFLDQLIKKLDAATLLGLQGHNGLATTVLCQDSPWSALSECQWTLTSETCLETHCGNNASWLCACLSNFNWASCRAVRRSDSWTHRWEATKRQRGWEETTNTSDPNYSKIESVRVLFGTMDGFCALEIRGKEETTFSGNDAWKL